MKHLLSAFLFVLISLFSTNSFSDSMIEVDRGHRLSGNAELGGEFLSSTGVYRTVIGVELKSGGEDRNGDIIFFEIESDFGWQQVDVNKFDLNYDIRILPYASKDKNVKLGFLETRFFKDVEIGVDQYVRISAFQIGLDRKAKMNPTSGYDVFLKFMLNVFTAQVIDYTLENQEQQSDGGFSFGSADFQVGIIKKFSSTYRLVFSVGANLETGAAADIEELWTELELLLGETGHASFYARSSRQCSYLTDPEKAGVFDDTTQTCRSGATLGLRYNF